MSQCPAETARSRTQCAALNIAYLSYDACLPLQIHRDRSIPLSALSASLPPIARENLEKFLRKDPSPLSRQPLSRQRGQEIGGGGRDDPRSPCPNPRSRTEGSSEREERAGPRAVMGVRQRWGGRKDSRRYGRIWKVSPSDQRCILPPTLPE